MQQVHEGVEMTDEEINAVGAVSKIVIWTCFEAMMFLGDEIEPGELYVPDRIKEVLRDWRDSGVGLTEFLRGKGLDTDNICRRFGVRTIEDLGADK